MKKRTKIIVLVAMLALLGVTGYLNIALNDSITTNANTSNLDYFAEHVEIRTQTRQEEFLYYDSIINSETSSQDAISEAQDKKLEIIAHMESELIMEGLIKAKGFEDVIVTYSSSFINVIVKGELEKTGVAQIVAIVQEQTGTAIDYIKITPV